MCQGGEYWGSFPSDQFQIQDIRLLPLLLSSSSQCPSAWSEFSTISMFLEFGGGGHVTTHWPWWTVWLTSKWSMAQTCLSSSQWFSTMDKVKERQSSFPFSSQLSCTSEGQWSWESYSKQAGGEEQVTASPLGKSTLWIIKDRKSVV